MTNAITTETTSAYAHIVTVTNTGSNVVYFSNGVTLKPGESKRMPMDTQAIANGDSTIKIQESD